MAGEPVLRVEDLVVEYPLPRPRPFAPQPTLRAVAGVSLELHAGECLGIVGESGCGKSSLGRGILQLVRPAAGRVWFDGIDLCTLPPRALRPYRRALQVVFQDPLASLNPRMTVAEIVGEPLAVHRPELSADARQRAVDAMLERVGLRSAMGARYPSEFSGGQAQRISIARAMIAEPRVLVCDEPVSSLDVSIQAQVCNLLRDLQRDTGVALLFISHDLAIVRYLSQRVLVMYLGRVMEEGPRAGFFARPGHPYSRALVGAVPLPDPDRGDPDAGLLLAGDPPSPASPPSGCVFRTRCPHAVPACAGARPALESLPGGRRLACHRWRELAGTPEDAPCPPT
jgi:oligopeptide transport system ATP-binding protein